MKTRSGSPAAFPLIRTKLLRPPVGRNFVARPDLFGRLDGGLGRKLTLVSAPAGYGKTTLLSAWLARNLTLSAWLSLDEQDSDLRVFTAYFIASLQSVFPDACPLTKELLNGSVLPPAEYLATSLLNEIADLPEPFVLVLDDYNLVAGKAVDHLLSVILHHQPRHMHLVIATRRDPALPIARLRAAQELTEFRLDNLRFSDSEVRAYLERCLGREVSPEIVTVLADRTEGWPVGLRLACLALLHQEDISAFLESFQGTHRYIMEYLLDEVLTRQPRSVQDFLQRTAILERLCAPLCDAVVRAGDPTGLVGSATPSGSDILAELERANLFLLRLDAQGEWFRYHPLFRGLLRHRLQQEVSERDLATLHAAAGDWLSQHGYGTEALDHFLVIGNMTSAVDLIARRRYALMNEAQWPLLEHLLGRFPPEAIERIPELLMLRAWLAYHHGNWTALPAAMRQLDEVLQRVDLSPEEVAHYRGEMSALRSLMAIVASDPESTIAHAQHSIRATPPELWIVRAMARLCLAGALQMTGDLQAAYDTVYRGYVEEDVDSDAFKATLLATACQLYWIAADLQALQQAADENRELSQRTRSAQMLGWAHHHLGSVAYHRNDLVEAERHFARVVQQPYLNYGECYVHSACGLALTYQAQGRDDEANKLAAAALRFMRGAGNAYLWPVVEALQAELALRQERVTVARQWAERFQTPPRIGPEFRFYTPLFTLGKARLAEGSAEGRARATDLLAQMRSFFVATHNTRQLIEALALQALIAYDGGEHAAADADLEQALALAQPGGFIRLFVDLGPKMAHLLAELSPGDEERAQYIGQILTAFANSSDHPPRSGARPALATAGAGVLIEPLTGREADVLALLALGLSDQEIAGRLIISYGTVRTHLKHIYAKLDVRNRREAVVRAGQLGILSPV